MNKKYCLTVLFLAAIACTRGAYAGSSYVGAGLGVGGHEYQPGASANLFGGYGGKISKDIYLGAEANASYGHFPKYGSTYGIGASLLPGLMITDNTMLYGRVGEEIQKGSHDYDATRFSTVYGAGLQSKLNKNWDVRGEYKHSNFEGDGSYNLGLVYKLND